jgi:ABC-2 type transport system permease protein
MTTAIDSPVSAIAAPTRPLLLRLLRSERIKVTSTKTWWLFGIAVVVTTALTLLANIGNTWNSLHNGGDGTPPNGFDDVTQAPAHLVQRFAADIFTSGQYFGGLFAMLLAILLITNEYYHQTATTTFLATPKRTYVIASKFLMAMLVAAIVWIVTTILDLIAGVIFFRSQGLSNELGSWTVERAILINLLMFALWGVFGLGIGALLRSQIGATVTAALLYTIGAYAAVAVFALLRTFVYHHDSVYRGLVLYPAFAAQIASSADSTGLPGGTHVVWWVGALVMVAYGVVMAGIGTWILRKRDIS